MQPADEIAVFDASWQQQLRNVITSRGELLDILGLCETDVGGEGGASEDFRLKVPRGFAARMRPEDPHDPLLLQVLSSSQETVAVPGYNRDPLQEAGAAIPRRGLIHKYHGRVLLVVTGSCAVNCRYCFRRHFPYSDNRNSREQWQEALQYIRESGDIEEVILSGGDPLVATDGQLAQLVEQIASIPHVVRLRIHTRLPIVIPERITETLLSTMTQTRLQPVMVVHCNHANEIDGHVARALHKLSDHGITLLNQAVLLRGVNDSANAQIALSKALFDAGTLPYYLHLLDPVQGAAHFNVPEAEARGLTQEMSARLAGYLVPKLVKEVAGASAKLPV